MQEGIFGPVLTVTSYADDDERNSLIARVNDTGYGLAATSWTCDITTSQRLSNKFNAAGVFVKMPPLPDMTAPRGGYKSSGWWRDRVPWAIDADTETKSVWLNQGH